ncbi:DNA polymerase sliding clamp [Halobaculum magnesiiphilum]|uniref:DNA polymerase sliding clamp n=1 Tax=Halobaculum magnesiiphilum TaxID=1017351 RepID=A0A8T8W972_9EURY|nr:DNA polymerase sliding clamp [Halobaculum magnesiiphilum]QZP36371.1 DNA polymerase sliding clamp [Halobaculum magnesiiphilum]
MPEASAVTDEGDETDAESGQTPDFDGEVPVSVRVRADTLKPLLSAVGALVDECRLTFGRDGIRAAAMDPATVAAVDAELDAAAAASYEADGTVVGVDVTRLEDILSMAAGDDPVTLALDPESFRLHVVADGLEYAMGLFDPDSVRGPPDVDDLGFEHTASLTVPVDMVGRFVTAAGMVADHLALSVDPDAETFVAAADGDTDDVQFTVTAEEAVAFSPGDAGSLLSLSYLIDIERAIPAGTDVRLTLGRKAPLGVAYDISGGDGRVEAFVAPRLKAV